MIALIISLRANHIANQNHKLNTANKRDSDRIMLFEKKCEALNEVDRQHARIATLMMVIAQKILLFRDNPYLEQALPDELERLKSNLKSVQHLDEKYETQRQGIEAIDTGADIAKQTELVANIRKLTIRIEKDIAHEQASLDELRTRVRA